MVFKSKKDIWMGIPIWAIIVMFTRMLYVAIAQTSIVGIILALIFLCFVGAIWFHTRYIIEDELLVIKYGFIKQTIHIKDILSIRKTTNPFVSPSLSIRRIEMNYGKYTTVQISPKDENSFIKLLEKHNSNIEYKKEGYGHL